MKQDCYGRAEYVNETYEDMFEWCELCNTRFFCYDSREMYCGECHLWAVDVIKKWWQNIRR